MIILHTLKSINQIFLAVFLINLNVLMINLANQLVFTEEEHVVSKFIVAILKEFDYCKEMMKNILIKL